MDASPQSSGRRPKAYGLADFDPDGMSIILTYMYGSTKLAHEGDAAKTPTLTWVGCSSADIRGDVEASQDRGLRLLTDRDHGRATSMLRWPYMAEDWPEPHWRRELQVMLMLGYKFEIEMVENLLPRLCSLLEGSCTSGADVVDNKV